MEIVSIPSVQFQKLNATTKDLINIGEWFLYEISYKDVPSASYYLSTGESKFFLSADGTIVKRAETTPEDLVLSKQVSFSDLPKLSVVRNFAVSWI